MSLPVFDIIELLANITLEGENKSTLFCNGNIIYPRGNWSMYWFLHFSCTSCLPWSSLEVSKKWQLFLLLKYLKYSYLLFYQNSFILTLVRLNIKSQCIDIHCTLYHSHLSKWLLKILPKFTLNTQNDILFGCVP